MLSGEGTRSWDGDEPEQIAAPCEALLGAAGLAEKQLRGTDRVDAERLGAGRPVLGGELERPARPGRARPRRRPRRRRCPRAAGARATRSGDRRRDTAISRLSSTRALSESVRPLRKSIADAASSASARSAVGSGEPAERRGEAPLGLDQVDPPQPERRERSAQAQGAVGVAGEKGVERRAHVRRLAVEELRVDRRLGKRQRPVRHVAPRAPASRRSPRARPRRTAARSRAAGSGGRARGRRS